jgi:hypothetical protein
MDVVKVRKAPQGQERVLVGPGTRLPRNSPSPCPMAAAYSHAMPGMQSQAAEQVSAMIFGV